MSQPGALHCDFCGRAIEGVYLRGQLGGAYCESHETSASCELCAAPVGDSAERFCRPCGADAVGTQPAVARALPVIRRDLNRMGLRLPVPVRVMLRTGSEMALLAAPLGGPTLGVTVSSGGTVVDLAVVAGLPRAMFGMVVAHECMHAWLVQREVFALPLPTEEGLCELAAYGWLGRQDDPRARLLRTRISTNPDPVYGDGFRLVRRLAQEHGVRALLTSLSDHGRLPGRPARL